MKKKSRSARSSERAKQGSFSRLEISRSENISLQKKLGGCMGRSTIMLEPIIIRQTHNCKSCPRKVLNHINIPPLKNDGNHLIFVLKKRTKFVMKYCGMIKKKFKKFLRSNSQASLFHRAVVLSSFI